MLYHLYSCDCINAFAVKYLQKYHALIIFTPCSAIETNEKNTSQRLRTMYCNSSGRHFYIEFCSMKNNFFLVYQHELMCLWKVTCWRRVEDTNYCK